MFKELKSRLFWPVVFVLGVCLAYLWFTRPKAPAPELPTVLANAGTDGRCKPFDLLITKVVRDRHRFELLEAQVEHWQLHQVEINLLKPGVVRSTVLNYIPDAVMRRLLKHSWNRSTAEIITTCEASVEFELPFDSIDAWKITIEGDTATVNAPAFEVDEVTVKPDTVVGWVAREDFLIDGELQKNILVKNIQRVLQKKVQSKAFRNRYRESCRKSLASFLLKQFSLIKRTADVKHIEVSFADDPTD